MLSLARKIVVMSILLAGLLAQAQAQAQDSIRAADKMPTAKTEVEKRIQAMCLNTTTYPSDCTETLWKAGPNTSDPRILLQINLEVIMKEVDIAFKQIGKTHNDSSCIDFLPSAIKYLQESTDQLNSAAAINKEGLKYSVLMSCAEIERCMATSDYDSDLFAQFSLLIKHPQILAKNSVEWAKAFLLN